MAEYVELIDKYRIVQSKDTDYNPPSYDWVDNTGEIVRCKDCKWWRGEGTICEGIGIDFDADGFCCEGKRKDGADMREES